MKSGFPKIQILKLFGLLTYGQIANWQIALSSFENWDSDAGSHPLLILIPTSRP